MPQAYYAEDLAYIHDVGFSHHARGLTPGLLRLFGNPSGLIVDLGCGGGVWAKSLLQRGFRVLGIDQSAALIALAKDRAPKGQFVCGSFLDRPLPNCRHATALGEVFNYAFDRRNSKTALRKLFRQAHRAISPGGYFVLDIAEPGRHSQYKQAFVEGKDWICIVEYFPDNRRARLKRRIVTFRQVNNRWRRAEETHEQLLFSGQELAGMLRDVGFRVRLRRSLGEYQLPPHVALLIARKDPEA